jgi:hypothetical protein
MRVSPPVLSVTASSISDPGATSAIAEKHNIRNAITGSSSDPITPPALHTFNGIWRDLLIETSSPSFYSTTPLVLPTHERDIP